MKTLTNRLRGSARPAALHLAISATVALLAMALIFLLWYPGALAGLQGVNRLVLILIGVDVVIGPLITLIVYAPGKKSLKFDLLVIAAMQSAALLYGLKAIENGRPAYVVFNVDRFDVVAVKEVEPGSLARAAAEFAVSPAGPRFVAARLPADPEQRNQILFSAVSGGADIPQMPEHFVPLADEQAQMVKRLRPLDELRTLNGLDDPAWRSLLEDFGRSPAELGYLPVRAGATDGAAILDAASGELLGLRLLTPRFEAPSSPPAGPRTPLSGPREGTG